MDELQCIVVGLLRTLVLRCKEDTSNVTMNCPGMPLFWAGILCICFSDCLAEFSNYPTLESSEETAHEYFNLNQFENAMKDYDDDDVDVPGNAIPGVPGRDFPTYAKVPLSNFSCANRIPGFYADEETRCQVWHYCRDGFQHSFLCPNGTIYNQRHRVCEWWFNVRCEDTEADSRVNEDLYIVPSSRELSENPLNMS